MTLWAIIKYYRNALTKSRMSLVNFAIHPFSFIFIVYVVSGGKLLSSALTGAMCSFIAGVGLADLPIELVGMKTRSRFYDIFMSLPGSTVEKMLGVTLGMSIPAIPYLALLATLLVLQNGVSRLPYIVIGMASLWVWATTLGMYIGVRGEEPLTVMRLGNILLIAFTVFPPVYYPATLLPESIRTFMFLLPTVAASHLIAYGPSMYAPIAMVSLLAWLVLCTIILSFIEFVED